ncbi:hypothetical protein BGZ50_003888, partial [Haplosporangium sp. Z 11]
MSFSNSPPLSPTSQATVHSRSPPLTPLPSLSTRLPGLTAFDRAVHVVNISNTTSQTYTVGQSQSTGGDDERVHFSPEEQLLLYGAYKQALKGNVKGLKPTFFDISARSKWQAWANMRGKTQDQAKDIYVDLVVKFLTKPGNPPDHHQLADEIVQRPSSPQLISPTSTSTSSPSTISSNLNKDLPPIQIPPTPSSTATASTSSSYATVASSLNNSPYQHQQRVRKGSIGHSIRSIATSVHSAAASVYELANESFVDTEIDDPSAVGSTISSIHNNNNSNNNNSNNNNSNTGPAYHEITETVVEETILNDDEYAAEVELARSAASSRRPSVPSSPTGFNAAEQQYSQVKADDSPEVYVHDEVDEEEGEDDEVYQSSVEYDDDESDKSSISRSIHESTTTTTTTQRDTYLHIKTLVLETKSDQMRPERRDDKDDFVDEGVFDEEEKDEQESEALQEPLIGALRPVAKFATDPLEEHAHSTVSHRLSRDGSISSGYGGSVLSDKESAPAKALDMAILGQESSLSGLESSPVEPYRVHAVFDTDISPLGSKDQKKDEERVDILNKDATNNETHSVTTTSAGTGSAQQELVCPVSKKSAASGAVCPAAMFAQARAAAAAAEASGNASSTKAASTEPLRNTVQSTHSSPGPITDTGDQTASTSNIMTSSPRAMTAPVSTPASSSSASSAVSAATNQGMRIGQGIVSRFSALRSSLAAASARAASSALSGGSSSSTSSNNNPNAVVVKDPVTQQSVTVVCPHIASTQVLEAEVVRLQTDISVLHERLDLLQESLKITSQTRALERRSPRGILKMVLRQGLINAVLLMIVFAVLYKRRSPIAFAVLAYIGQGRKEGEAGWRALMRWFAGLVQVGQRNQ